LTAQPKVFAALYTTQYCLRMWKVWLFWSVRFWRCDNANIEFRTVALATSTMSSTRNFLSTNPKNG